MSNFNEANDLASQLVYGRCYQSNEPRPRPERLVLVKGDSIAVVPPTDSILDEWAETASSIERLLGEGYRLGCDMNVSWNGRYDLEGDPEPGDGYMPCAKPVAVNLDGRCLCGKHSMAEYPDRVRIAVDEATDNAEEL